MKEHQLFKLALGLAQPWEVVKLDFDAAAKQLTIGVDFPKGSLFGCPECGVGGCGAYDTKPMRWRHLNFFQHEAYIEARVPRVTCDKCGVKQVEVPWSRPGSGFTLLFEALIMALAQRMTIAAVSQIIGEHDTRIWRVLHHHVEEARDREDFSEVRSVGIDETAARRGHDYITLFMDLDESRVMYATEGKGGDTIGRFVDDLRKHNGTPGQVKDVSMDMSQAFISGVQEHLPDAAITFDKFHIMQIMGKAVDEVRRAEQVDCPELKKTRFLWLKNPKNLTASQAQRLDDLRMQDLNLKTMRAYHIRLNLQEFWKQPAWRAEMFLKKWFFWATHCRLEPVVKAARTIRRHQEGILRWFKSRINNGILEGINSLLQAAKSKARGYRTSRNLITMAYMIAGRLEFNLPTHTK